MRQNKNKNNYFHPHSLPIFYHVGGQMNLWLIIPTIPSTLVVHLIHLSPPQINTKAKKAPNNVNTEFNSTSILFSKFKN